MCGEEEEENALLLKGVECKESISFASLSCVKIWNKYKLQKQFQKFEWCQNQTLFIVRESVKLCSEDYKPEISRHGNFG